MKTLVVITFVYLTFLMIANFFRYEHINGKLHGFLVLEKDRLNIDRKAYELNEIDKIEISNVDIKGRFDNFVIEFKPRLSNGVKNYLKILLNSGETVCCYFQQTKNSMIKNNKDELINYYLNGKLSWLSLLGILEMTNYDEIQRFKKTLPPQLSAKDTVH